MIHLAVFDLDGTLVDSRRDLASAANALLEESGAPPLDEEAVGRMVGDGAAMLVHRAFEAAGHAEPEDALSRFLALYGERLLETTRPYPGIVELLDALERGTAMAVLTNKPRAMAETVLSGLGLRRYFSDVFGGDGPYPRKPQADGLRALMRAAGVEGDSAMMIGDSVVDLRTARGAGARICLAGYGFSFASVPVSELRGDEWIVDAPLDLATRLGVLCP
jgi:phosphoglycolate phosphatase